MTPVQKLEAAIAKLEQQRHDSYRLGNGDPWSVYTFGILCGVTDLDGFDPVRNVAVVTAGDLRWADAELIVTLHRTIDAQLELLRLGLRFANITPNTTTNAVVVLADAILGDPS